MAFVVLSDGSSKSLSAEQGTMVWNILNCVIEPPNDKWDAFCCEVSRIYLNPKNAPESYLKQHPSVEDKNYAAILGATNV